MGIDRRRLVRDGIFAAGGVALGVGALTALRLFPPRHLPFNGGYAAASDLTNTSRFGRVEVVWSISTTEPVVALTFDDGPGPRWTPMVLDTLDDYQVPATFFMLGEHLTQHADLVLGRLDRHEVGNHTWSHPDLAMLDEAAVEHQLTRTHETIHRLLGRVPRLMRPPYGHLGGSTLVVADRMGYDVILWSHQMAESNYLADPPGQVREIVTNVRAGQIVLAHDVGSSDRLIALRQLGDMIAGLRRRGLRFVTVSELRSLAAPTSHATPSAH